MQLLTYTPIKVISVLIMLITLVVVIAPLRPPMPFTLLKSFFLFLALRLPQDCPPSTLVVFLGILFSAIHMTLSIPQAKLDELLQIIKTVTVASTISHRRLQSILGLMSFVTACVCPGRIFMSALLNGFCSLSQHGFLTICDDIRANQQWWLCFLVKFNGVSIIPSPVYQPDVLITDACLIGAGGHFRHQSFHIDFS